jgi:hypothetical protein
MVIMQPQGRVMWLSMALLVGFISGSLKPPAAFLRIVQ